MKNEFGIKSNSIEVNSEGNLLPQEIEDIVAIVDIGPKHLDKVTTENLDEIIKNQINKIKKKREKANNFGDEKPSLVLKKILDRSSASHAIQCPINTTEDWKALDERVILFTENNQLTSEKEKAVELINNFIKRQIEMKELLTNLYSIDIWERIGKEKKDKKYWEKARTELSGMKEKIKNILAEYKIINRDNISEDSNDKIKTISELIESESEEDLEEKFYTGVCQSFSALIIREEELNEEKIKEAFDILEK